MNQIISTPAAPAAIGPYSQAIQAGGLLFLSGTMPIDPATGALAEPQIAAQAEQVMKNIGAVLQAAGCTFEDVVKTTCFLTLLRLTRSTPATLPESRLVPAWQ